MEFKRKQCVRLTVAFQNNAGVFRYNFGATIYVCAWLSYFYSHLVAWVGGWVFGQASIRKVWVKMSNCDIY